MAQAGQAGRAHRWRWWSRVVGGWLLIVAGLAGFVLPIIPGVPLLLAGLALLAPEYAWARKAMAKVKQWVAQLRQKFRKKATAKGRA